MSIWVNPTALNYVTSGFSLLRRHPVTRILKPHTGTDFRAPTGTPIRAAADGTVERSAYDWSAGNHVRINHGGGATSRYYHMSARHVVVGQRVSAGQTVGLAGSTGTSTAPHLHFEIRIWGIPINPVPYLAARVGAAVLPRTSPIVTPTATRDWFDMATQAELQAIVRRVDFVRFYSGGARFEANLAEGTYRVYRDNDEIKRRADVLGRYGYRIEDWPSDVKNPAAFGRRV